jgi:hypothetical protein
MRRWGYKLQWSLQSGVKPASTTLPNEERRQQMLQMSSPGAAFETARQTVTLRIRLMRAAKIWSTWEHASLVRLQPHYVYILVNSKGAVTTALHAHSMRKRLVRLKKDRFTPPLPPCPPQVSFPFHIAPAQNKISLFSFIVFGINFARARFVFAPLCSGVAFANNLSQPILPWSSHSP